MARIVPAMVDMRRTPAENDDAGMGPMGADAPAYPYGLCISFGDPELKKLGLDDEVEVGDLIHIHAFAKVTAVSKTDTEANGPCCRVELVLAYISAEDEEDEDEADEEAEKIPGRASRLYG